MIGLINKSSGVVFGCIDDDSGVDYDENTLYLNITTEQQNKLRLLFTHNPFHLELFSKLVLDAKPETVNYYQDLKIDSTFNSIIKTYKLIKTVEEQTLKIKQQDRLIFLEYVHNTVRDGEDISDQDIKQFLTDLDTKKNKTTTKKQTRVSKKAETPLGGSPDLKGVYKKAQSPVLAVSGESAKNNPLSNVK